MANNRMYLVNKRTGAKVYIAKYYPSTGWYVPQHSSGNDGLVAELNKAFDAADFGHLTPDEKAAKDAQPGFGRPYAASVGDEKEWEIKYES